MSIFEFSWNESGLNLMLEQTDTSLTSVPYRGSKFLLSSSSQPYAPFYIMY